MRSRNASDSLETASLHNALIIINTITLQSTVETQSHVNNARRDTASKTARTSTRRKFKHALRVTSSITSSDFSSAE
jgi:hypothetical protein